MTRARSVLLAALIVCSAVVGAVGPALAQTATDSGPVTYEYTGSPETLVVDTSALDGGTEFKVEYTTQGGPSTGTTVLARETYNTANLDGDVLLFLNSGAYESVNVTVSEYSGGEPKFDTWDGRGETFHTKVGTTGGDSDLTCDVSDKIADIVGYVDSLDCNAQPGSTTVNTTGTDATQTKTDIYQSAQNSKAQTDIHQTTLDNLLSDTKTQARIIGKNAYIRALNNGASKAAAKTEAKTEVDNYYSVKKTNLLNEWDASLSNAKYLENVSDSESGISDGFHTIAVEDAGQDVAGAYFRGLGTTTVSLPNGTTTTVKTVDIEFDEEGDKSVVYTWGPTRGVETVDGRPDMDVTTARYVGDPAGIKVQSTAATDSPVRYVDFGSYPSRLSEIESQATTVKNDIDTLAENTYSAYQQGEINNSDLVDPYVLASQQSAGSDFQGWTAAQLTLLGTNSPENFDQIGSFNVTTGSGEQYEGVLFSQENPPSGQFENGTTYDTANIGGTQYVVTSDQIVELSGTFTIDRITTTSGETTENVTIQKTTYETTNITELKQQYEDLAYRRAQIEAREKALQQSAGGGLLGGSSVPPVVALAVIGTLLGIVVLQN